MNHQVELNKAIIIPGAQKSGTTSIFKTLIRHSKILKPKYKEPQFFVLDKSTIISNFDWYKNLYNYYNYNKYIIDASTFYFSSRRARDNIKHFIINPRILVILRDPVKRAYSAWAHANKIPGCFDKRSFSEILSCLQGNSPEDIIKSEEFHIKLALKNNKLGGAFLDSDFHRSKFNAYFSSNFEDPLWNFKYFRESFYSLHLKEWEKIFDKKVKVIFFEQFVLEPTRTMKSVLDFLDLNVQENLLKIPHVHKTKLPKNKLSENIDKFIRNYPIFINLINKYKNFNLINKSLDMIKNAIYYRPKLTQNEYEKAREIMKTEYDFWISNFPQVKIYWRFIEFK